MDKREFKDWVRGRVWIGAVVLIAFPVAVVAAVLAGALSTPTDRLPVVFLLTAPSAALGIGLIWLLLRHRDWPSGSN